MPSTRCCRDVDFTNKVVLMFVDAYRLLGDANFIKGLRLWARRTKITNMHLERLFSKIKMSLGVQKASPDVERLAGVGYLTQVLASHMVAGGNDPRVVTRKQLLEEGAPIAAADSVANAPSRAPGHFIQFKKDRAKSEFDQAWF
jgi:hypothetical protein